MNDRALGGPERCITITHYFTLTTNSLQLIRILHSTGIPCVVFRIPSHGKRGPKGIFSPPFPFIFEIGKILPPVAGRTLAVASAAKLGQDPPSFWLLSVSLRLRLPEPEITTQETSKLYDAACQLAQSRRK